ncbi:S-adenosyl-L-methionine-dependent methyltransferase [Jimgerdemannia flammicorona]|uniref:S-adenosyl-L-methionine-dependent methyltransferase n=2 Tax=Jimgerdemannia flammicorona TaxID=994334 RepID=A0A433D8J3_9FUNG|nr:S-adenosyl-L-methionine-dependent methyltransferase [Jimgerdemannia flammicorona]RUS34450.1 S-adenosyl-L-methionine-dependent methyltransferase [Jimgerdemannia flammicorona]
MIQTRRQSRSPPTAQHAVPLVKKENRYLDHILAHAERNNPESIIEETHKFAIERHWLMNVGPEKSPLIEQVLLEKRPKVAIEIGCYLGYSAIRFAAYIRDTLGIRDVKYYSFEISEYNANIARKVGIVDTLHQLIIDFAGLSHIITVITGPFNESLERLPSYHNLLGKVDFVLIDHHNELTSNYWRKAVYSTRSVTFSERCFTIHFPNSHACYVPNRLSCIQGTTIVADNVINPGAPDYLEYVRSDLTRYQTRLIEGWLEYYEGVIRDGLEVSVWLK